MLEIKKDRIPYDYEVKDRLEFICKYANRDARFFNGNVISIERTNLHYVEPHNYIKEIPPITAVGMDEISAATGGKKLVSTAKSAASSTTKGS